MQEAHKETGQFSWSTARLQVQKRLGKQPLNSLSIVKASYFKILFQAFINLPIAVLLRCNVPVGFQLGHCAVDCWDIRFFVLRQSLRLRLASH